MKVAKYWCLCVSNSALKLLKKGSGCGRSEAGVRWEREEGNLQALESHHVEKRRRKEGEGAGEEMEEG